MCFGTIWTLINVTDPSSHRVLQDIRTTFFNPDRDSLKTTTTDGFILDALVWDTARQKATGRLGVDPSSPYLWEGWEVAPQYRERLKKSYYIIRDSWAGAAKAEIVFK